MSGLISTSNLKGWKCYGCLLVLLPLLAPVRSRYHIQYMSLKTFGWLPLLIIFGLVPWQTNW